MQGRQRQVGWLVVAVVAGLVALYLLAALRGGKEHST